MTSDITAIDNFCGAGGSTTGLKAAGVRVIHAANHWNRAIETHNTNHPEVDHSCCDLNQADPRLFPRSTIAWFSPSCTTHSPAGGRKRKQTGQLHLWEQKKALDPSVVRSRMTAFDVIRFSEYHKYEVVVVENVVEFVEWGDDVTGDMFEWWLKGMLLLGYEHQIVYFNAQFAYPNAAPQSRDRIYIVFHRRGNRKPNLEFCPPATCPECGEVRALQTWKWNKKHKRFNTYGVYGSTASRRGQYTYRCPKCQQEIIPHRIGAKVAIDWNLPTTKIKDRSEPLSENTLRRIEKGLKRFIAPHLIHNGHWKDDRVYSLDDPTPTVTTRGEFSVSIPPFFVHRGYSTDSMYDRLPSIDDPAPTQTTSNKLYLAQPFIDTARSNNNPTSIEEPTATLTTGRNHSLIQPPSFLSTYHGGRDAVRSMEEPSPTIATNKQIAIVQPEPFLTSYYGNGGNTPISNPAPTQCTVQGHALIEPDWSALVEECGYRMIAPHEAQLLQGFPREYQILGKQDEKFRQIGNAVHPGTAEMVARAVIESLS